MSVKFVDNSKQVLSDFEKAIEVGLEAIGQTAEGHAKLDCPVDTGRLRNSISHAVSGKDAVIGSNVEYAPAVEFDDHKKHITGKAHFLRDAATTHNDEYKRIMENELKGK